ncbi:MAG: signal peptidase I [Clostridia bacterium]|nr:signal peptidase I [Clostridia bacterium]
MSELNEATEGTEVRSASVEAAEKEKGKKSVGREIFEWVMVVVVAVAAALVIRTFIFEPVRVDGNSMQTTLHDKEYMLVTKYQYLFGEPSRFDVVICRYPGRGSTNFVKRVVGLPGDTVAVAGGLLYINGEPVEEAYINTPMFSDFAETVVQDGHYFVMGDNRNNSNDSRNPSVGQIAKAYVRGKVRIVAWPFADFRVVQ